MCSLLNFFKKKLPVDIKILKAFHGDSILIKAHDKAGNPYNILVDGGTNNTFTKTLKIELKTIDVIHLLVLTHIDNDHIQGIIKFLKSDLFKKIEVKKYWFNGGNLLKIRNGSQIGYSEGLEFEKFLRERENSVKWNAEVLYTGKVLSLSKGIDFRILSPTRNSLDNLYKGWKNIKIDDESVQMGNYAIKNHPQLNQSLNILAKKNFKPSSIKSDIINDSSISFILNTPSFRGLFLADSRAETIVKSLKSSGYTKRKKLKVDLVKISHHGSKNNTSNDLLDLIDCEKFIISTNGGTGRAKHPNRETVARILCHEGRNKEILRTICFNYPENELEKRIGKFINDDERELYNFKTEFNCNLIQYE